jgi:GNAT superfamily N-acetyltransferase
MRLVGFEELSATAVRDRVLARRAEFWSGSALTEQAVVGLHDPLFFHQLGGFGALALSADGQDAGYLLGLVSADRLAVVHALAVHPTWRRRGVAGSLLSRFAELATSLGARAVQGVAVSGDPAVEALGARFGTHAALSAEHGGPGEDRLLLTRALPLA